jgi:hypothetical protein
MSSRKLTIESVNVDHVGPLAVGGKPIGVTKSEVRILVENRKSSTVESMMSDLESLVGGTPEGSGSDNGDSEDA